MGKMHKDLLKHYKECVTEKKWLTPGDARIMLSHIDAIEAEKDKLIDNVGQLQKELHKEREGKKVVLPKEVADALDLLIAKGMNGYSIISLSSVYSQLFRDYPAAVIGALKTVDCWRARYDIISALVYGYTIEEIEEPPSVESRIQSTIEAELNRQGITSPAPIDYVAKCLTDLISPIIVKDALQHE